MATRLRGFDRYYSADRIHSHTVVLRNGKREESVTVDCFPGGILCEPFVVDIASVSPIGAAQSPRAYRWYERLHRAFVFSRLAEFVPGFRA